MLISAGVLLSVPGIAGWYFLAKHRIRIVAFVTLIREASFFIPVLLILDLIEDPERKLLFAGVFYFLSRLIFALVFLVRLLAENGFCLKVKRATYSFLFKDSLALLYASIVSSVTIGMQIYMLKLLGVEFALGVYGALFKQIFYIQLLSLSFIMVFFPLLSRAWVEDRPRYSRLASALSELTLVVVLPLAVTGVLSGRRRQRAVLDSVLHPPALGGRPVAAAELPRTDGHRELSARDSGRVSRAAASRNRPRVGQRS